MLLPLVVICYHYLFFSIQLSLAVTSILTYSFLRERVGRVGGGGLTRQDAPHPLDLLLVDLAHILV